MTQATSTTQKPGRKKQDAGSQRHRGDDLLDEPPQLLDHAQAVGGLNAGALQLVVKKRVFVGRQVQPRGVVHDAHTDVADEFVGQQGVAIVHDAIQHRRQTGQAEFQAHQPPEVTSAAA